jgi:hypothetical protein
MPYQMLKLFNIKRRMQWGRDKSVGAVNKLGAEHLTNHGSIPNTDKVFPT